MPAAGPIISFVVPLAILGGTVALLPAVVGVARADRPWSDRVGLAMIVALAALGVAGAAATYDPGVRDAELAGGLVLAAVGVGFAAFVYYALGRLCARHPIVLAVVGLLSLVALAYYAFVLVIYVEALVHCPPGAYECPV